MTWTSATQTIRVGPFGGSDMLVTSLRRFGVGAMVTAALLLTGCGGQGHQSAPSGATGKTVPMPTKVPVSPSISTDSDADARKAVLSSYYDFMGDWHMASFDPSDQGAKLSDHASGQALDLITKDVQRSRREGTISKGPLNFEPTVTALDLQTHPATAFIDDCVDATKYLKYSASDGSPVGTRDADTRRQHVTAHLIATDGSWKVDELHIYQSGSCR